MIISQKNTVQILIIELKHPVEATEEGNINTSWRNPGITKDPSVYFLQAAKFEFSSWIIGVLCLKEGLIRTGLCVYIYSNQIVPCLL